MLTIERNSEAYAGDELGWITKRHSSRIFKEIAAGKRRITKKQQWFIEAVQDGARMTCRKVIEALGPDIFVAITIDKAHNSLVGGYGLVPNNWATVVKRGSNPDFKPMNVSAIAGQASLPIVKPKQNYLEVGTIPDELRQTITLDKYGIIWSFSMEALLNDELGALAGYAEEFGKAWQRTLNSEVFGANNLQNTGNIYDAAALFAAGHSNALATGVNSLNAANVKAAIAKMMLQTGLGSEQLYIAPTVLIVGPKLAFDAKELLGSATYQVVTLPNATGNYEPNGAAVLTATNTSNSGRVGDLNMIRSSISTLVVDPSITGTQWYLQCDPNIHPWLLMNFLNGQDAPEIIAEPLNTGGAFERDAQRYKIRGAMAAEVSDYRPIVRGSDT